MESSSNVKTSLFNWGGAFINLVSKKKGALQSPRKPLLHSQEARKIDFLLSIYNALTAFLKEMMCVWSTIMPFK